MLLCVLLPASAQGLRHSVCVVEPEYSDADKSLMGDYALYTARAGMRSASRALTAYKNEGTFGSGVVVEEGGKKYILTNLHVVGYAGKATIIFQLHEKTVRYEHCDVVHVGLTDLAAIALPSDCEMIALPVYAGEIEEDVSIVAAGFPELANKPSWQLTRGSISNARVDVDSHEHASRIIQHTASIDPGSSGGPLLLKNKDGKCQYMEGFLPRRSGLGDRKRRRASVYRYIRNLQNRCRQGDRAAAVAFRRRLALCIPPIAGFGSERYTGHGLAPAARSCFAHAGCARQSGEEQRKRR